MFEFLHRRASPDMWPRLVGTKYSTVRLFCDVNFSYCQQSGEKQC